MKHSPSESSAALARQRRAALTGRPPAAPASGWHARNPGRR